MLFAVCSTASLCQQLLLVFRCLRATAVTFYVQIYERDVMFRQQVGNLQLIVGIYNDVQATILPVEKPLITQKLEAVDAALKKGLQVNVCKSCIRDNKICQLQANSCTMQYSASSPACSVAKHWHSSSQ